MGIQEIIKQLEACGYTCETGPLENNEAFAKLKEIAETDCDACLDEEERRQKERCKVCKAEMAGKAILGTPPFGAAKLRELLQLTGELFEAVLNPHRGDGIRPLRSVEIMFVADVFRDAISRWCQGSGKVG